MADAEFEQFCQSVVSRVNVEHDVDAHFPRGLKVKRNTIEGYCPFCQDGRSKTRKLYFYLPNKNWKCHKCGEGGQFLGFFVKMGEAFRDAATRLANQHGVELPESWQPKEKFQHAPEKKSTENSDSNDRVSGKDDLPTENVGKEAGLSDDEKSKASKGKYKSERILLPAANETHRTEALRLLERVWKRMTLSVDDQDMLYQKRGLEHKTSIDLGFKSNPRSNEKIIIDEASGCSKLAKINSGLFQWNGNRVGMNRQFFGYGFKKNYIDKETGEKKQSWGWTQPIIIPYFDTNGTLISLRPHKGGAKKGRVQRTRLYVPRRNGEGTKYCCDKCVITESEFKCAALWQMLGEGSKEEGNDIIGVCGLPGIQAFQNIAVENDLIDYLNEINPSEIIVVFDNEEKGDPSLPGYNQDFEKRFDSIVYARVLTEKVEKWFPQSIVKIGNLPNEWRDDKGKADWDGVLGRMVHNELEAEKIEDV